MSQNYTIQEISEKTGVSIFTLRYYERIGLLDVVHRMPNGHRRYGDADIKRLFFLTRLKATGMRINEMVRYVELFRQGDSTITIRRCMLEEHLKNVQRQAQLLQETMQLLEYKIHNYHEQEAMQQRVTENSLYTVE